MKNMAEAGKVKIGNKIGYGAIAGSVGGVIEAILQFLASAINLGTYSEIEDTSQRFLSTTAGNPNLVGYFIINTVVGVVLGIIFGILIFLLMTRAGWEPDLTRYLIVAIVFGVVFFLLDITLASILSIEFDLLIDGSIQFILDMIAALILGLTFYNLEEQFDSAS